MKTYIHLQLIAFLVSFLTVSIFAHEENRFVQHLFSLSNIFHYYVFVNPLGEFSKRAFLNGKMDLTAVEGLGDLISAETEMQRAQALNQMSGSLGSLYESWRDRIAKVYRTT